MSFTQQKEEREIEEALVKDLQAGNLEAYDKIAESYQKKNIRPQFQPDAQPNGCSGCNPGGSADIIQEDQYVSGQISIFKLGLSHHIKCQLHETAE